MSEKERFVLKNFILLALTLLIGLSACSSSNGEDKTNGGVFGEISNSASYDVEWITLPKEATVIRTEETNGELKATFKGCEFVEINSLAKQIFESLTERGCTVYNAMDPLTPVKLITFEEAKIDIRFAGCAYCYYYTNGDSIYMLTIHYYGSAGGKYGNGQSILVISNVTDKIGSLIKE